MQLTVHAFSGGDSSTLDVNEAVFSVPMNGPVVHQVVTAYQACGRADTKGWKNRSAVRGGGAKPWRQKGTGRARAGTNTSPLWRTGGVTFGSGRANHQQKVNRKMYRLAMRGIISEQLRNEAIKVFDAFELAEIKTKQVRDFLQKEGVERRVLFIDDGLTDNFVLSARNIPAVSLCDAALIDPVTLFKADKVYISAAGLKKLEERFA